MSDPVKDFKKRIAAKKVNIAVVGLGYVGLPLAVEFARSGFRVFGIEIDQGRLNHLKKKESYITDIPTKQLRPLLASGKLLAVNNFNVLSKSDVVIICVPTPLKKKYYPDISFIEQAVKSISNNLKTGSLVILESTTYPGTTEEVILPLLETNRRKHGRDFFLSFSPERIDPGNKNFPVHKIPKVVGGLSAEATELAVEVYKNIIERVIPVSSARVAEMVKLLENTFRLINIGLIDEMAVMAHKMNVDIWEVVQAASSKPFGFMTFFPGPGVGGHCIPKDPLYLYWKARKYYGFKSRFIKLASDIISRMPEYIVERIEELLKDKRIAFKKAKVLVVGVTYKKDVRDLRKSPSLEIIDILKERVSDVAYFDPLIPYLKFNHTDLKCMKLSKKALAKFDCVLIATDHSCLDYDFLLHNSRVIFDARNVYKNSRDKKVFRL